MNTPLLSSGRTPREMTRLAKEYFASHGQTNVKGAHYWYRLYDGRKTPQWLLVHVKAYAERSIVCMVCSDGDGGYYLTPYVCGPRELEGKVLSEWRRITEEREQEE